MSCTVFWFRWTDDSSVCQGLGAMILRDMHSKCGHGMFKDGGDCSFMRYHIRFCLVLALLVSGLCGCGSEGTEVGESQAQSQSVQDILNISESEEDNSVPTAPFSPGGNNKEDFKPYQAPEFADSAFHADLAQGKGDVLVDISAVSQGYVAVSAKADSRLKVQVIKQDADKTTYTYNIAQDGTPSVFPIQSGDGSYSVIVAQNTTDTKYAVIYNTDIEVKLEDEFQPFLRPSDYVNYNKDSKCVKEAAELAKKAEDAVGVVSQVYSYICGNVDYDWDLAKDIQSKKVTVYLPDVDEILSSGKGICFDYAALTAAMLRSQGIPTKMIFGDVSPNNLYHAWNMFYTEQTGWVTVDIKVEADSWNRLDLTFSANGADGSFIGDGSNYTDINTY